MDLTSVQLKNERLPQYLFHKKKFCHFKCDTYTRVVSDQYVERKMRESSVASNPVNRREVPGIGK